MARGFQSIALGELVSFRTGKLDSNASTLNGKYPFFTCAQETYRTDTCSFDCECVLLAGNNAAGIYPLKYFTGKFDAYQRTYVIQSLDEARLSNRFLYYAMRPKLDHLRNISTGAATKFLTLTLLKSLDVELPPLETQRKIASILSAYDDLIENNTQRIKILEEMARNIYREWFVNFRFPGYEQVKMVDSPLGLIPEGWEVKAIDDVAVIHRGRSYKSEDLVEDGGLPFLNLKCVERDGGFRHDGIKRYQGQFKDSQVATTGEIIMAVTDMTQERRLVARAARVPGIGEDKAVISMDLVKISPKHEINSEYLYGLFRFSSFPDEVKQFANGANVLHLKPDHISAFTFPLPSKVLQRQYGEIAKSVYLQCDNLNTKNQNLRQTRDLLLPKLISGDVVV